MVVLGGDEEDGVGLGDGGLNAGGFGVAVEVLIIKGNFADVDQGELDRGLQVSGEELDEGGAEGGLAEASGDACDLNGGGELMSRMSRIVLLPPTKPGIEKLPQPGLTREEFDSFSKARPPH